MPLSGERQAGGSFIESTNSTKPAPDRAGGPGGTKGKGEHMEELVYKEEVYEIVGCAIEVHHILGSGFLEGIYHEAMQYELHAKGIPFETNTKLAVVYKGVRLQKEYFADLICYSKILLELKALDFLSGREESQVINYLKISGLRVGLLINFGSYHKLEWKRLIV
jgi:GxxExxY protein